MALRDDLLPLLDLGGVLGVEFGVRRQTVTVVVETWSGPVGMPASTLVTTDTLLLEPAPVVEQGTMLPGGVSFGAGPTALSAGRLYVGQYLLTVTRPYAGGGYTRAQLAPAGGHTLRVYYRLTGDEFLPDGERYELVTVDTSDPMVTRLAVQPIDQATP